MKQAAAILLLTIFSFNIFGYRLLSDYLANKADTRLERVLDAEAYNDADLISIKQPTNLPYYNNSATFERLDGEVNINGTIYKYVKCRIYKDSLEMLCIPHIAKMKIENSEDDFFKGINDFPQGDSKKQKGSEQKNCKIAVAEFEKLQIEILNSFFIQFTTQSFLKNDAVQSQAFIESAKRPPDDTYNIS